MPYLFRRRLVCFYCGYKSLQYKSPTLRQWQCGQCDAVNHLDEHGEITDPPVADSPHPDTSYKYATEAAQSISPDLTAPVNTIFCSECLKNQHIFVETLATYLPDPSDPRYTEFVRNLPAYRGQLEERYPQVCTKCVHLVNNRIESMTYLARTENLKLSLAKTRKGLVPLQSGWRAKDGFIRSGCLMWWLAILGQFTWHLLGLTLSSDNFSSAGLPQCLLRSAYTFTSDLSCYRAMTPTMPYFLLAGWLSIWWNPRIHKTASGSGRLKNLNDYYFLQLIFLLSRSVAFWIITSQQQVLEIPAERVHGASVIFMVIFGLASLNIVQIRRLPTLADYKLEKVQAPKDNKLTLDAPTAGALMQQTPTRDVFPLAAMAPSISGAGSVFGSVSHNRKFSDSTEMSTVPDCEWLQERMNDVSSEMDWTPTQPAFNPRHPVLSKAKDTSCTPQQSPFKHKLPPAPQHPLHKARKPPTQVTFHRASEEERIELRDNLGKASFLDSWGLPTESKDAHEMSMGAPKLKLSQETGLENLFNNVFSLQDEPQTARSIAPVGVGRVTEAASPWPRTAIGILLITVPISIFAAWSMTRRAPELSWSINHSMLDYQSNL